MKRRRTPKFKRRKRSWWPTLRLALLLAVLLGAWWLWRPAISGEEWQRVGHSFGMCGERGRPFACVTDGDTITLGYGNSARRIRLTGFDAPEMAGACPAESAKARAASAELRRWLNQGSFDWNGGNDPPYDQYGRELRSIRRKQPDGETQLLSDHMIDTGFAAGDGFWEQRDWCD